MTQNYEPGSEQYPSGQSDQGYGWQHPPGYPVPPQNPEGQSASTTSLVLGIIGLFTFGIILGPLAIYFAVKAERNGVSATPGKVIGWIVTILHGLGILIGIIAMIFVIAAASSSLSNAALLLL
ncbi:hypothetical protein GCM10009720_09850 [Yaniella flava]|uniref:DUF4190 domain-containing protein n=1 Tax=Yaniella flava TaxID=287930 RepID=A0ABP5FU16_9MICC|nr:hypothetical protein [Micrococcaceae bacterium]